MYFFFKCWHLSLKLSLCPACSSNCWISFIKGRPFVILSLLSESKGSFVLRPSHWISIFPSNPPSPPPPHLHTFPLWLDRTIKILPSKKFSKINYAKTTFRQKYSKQTDQYAAFTQCWRRCDKGSRQPESRGVRNVSICPNLSRTAGIDVLFSINSAVVFDFIYFRFRPSKAKWIGNVLTNRQNTANYLQRFFCLLLFAASLEDFKSRSLDESLCQY